MDQKPISYESLKIILSNCNLETRRQINNFIPSLRKTESILPLSFDYVAISDNSLRINDRDWNIWEVSGAGVDEDDVEDLGMARRLVLANRSIVMYFQNAPDNFTKRQKLLHSRNRVRLEIDGSPEENYKKLIFSYLRNGSRIESLDLWSVPKCLTELEKPWKFRIANLNIGGCSVAIFREFQKFIDTTENLKKITLTVRQNSLVLFNDPMIKNSDELHLQFPYNDPIPIEDLLISIKNRHLHVTYPRFPMDELRKLFRNWQLYWRPIGHQFTLLIENYTEVLAIFEMAKNEFNGIAATLPELGATSFFRHSVIIPLNENIELVLFGGNAFQKWPPFQWSFRMEIMKKGRAVPKTQV